MSILIPGTSHQITWSVQNLLDTTTYYVKAVIRDVRTETVLATILLNNLGGGRFSNYWNVPQDPTGFGREIEIEKTVYTDSGYTTVSNIYGRWLNRYTVFNIANRLGSTGGYGGHGTQVDYKEITKIIKKEIESILKSIDNLPKPQTPDPIDLQPMVKSLNSINSGLSGLAHRVSNVEDQSSSSIDKITNIAKTHALLEKNVEKLISQSIDSIQEKLDKEISSVLKLIKDIEKPEKVDIKSLESRVNKQLDEVVRSFEKISAMDRKKLYIDITDAIIKLQSKSQKSDVITPIKEGSANNKQQTVRRLLTFT